MASRLVSSERVPGSLFDEVMESSMLLLRGRRNIPATLFHEENPTGQAHLYCAFAFAYPRVSAGAPIQAGYDTPRVEPLFSDPTRRTPQQLRTRRRLRLAAGHSDSMS